MANFKAKNDSDLEEQAAKNDDFNSRIDDNKTKAGRLNNRRIRIVIMPTVTQVMNLSKQAKK